MIINTLSITIAQRTRELATLRTIGATRNQVLGSVMLESLVIGLLASVVGLFLGLLLAKGMEALFDAAGVDLPKTSVVFGTRTDSLPGSYTRYLVNGMRKELGFQGVPVRLNFRNSRNPYDE